MIALIDADGFFASCELSRNPQLRGKPVMVLGRIGSFILAKTQEAKERGVTTVMPYWEAKKRCPEGIFIEGDFRFYTLMSRRLMAILKNWSPTVQISSIDEAYMDLSGLEEMHQKPLDQIGDMIREDVWRQLGITVTVGISVNKVLAKMACELKKPNGTSVIQRSELRSFLKKIEIGDIPGIGRSRQEAMKHYGLKYASELRALPMSIIKNLFGRNGILLWKELHGEYMFHVNPNPRIPKQIGRTSSLHQATSDLRQMEGLAFYHLERSVDSLHRHHLRAGEIHLYLRDREFKRTYLTHHFDEATDDFVSLAGALKKLTNQIPKNKWWRSAGILLTALASNQVRQLSLFEGVEKSIREEKRNLAKDQLNQKYGQFTVTSGSSLFFVRKRKTGERRLDLM